MVQETFDPNWRAYEGDRAQPIQADAVGHMLIPLTPGSHVIRMVFEAPAEVVAGRAAGIVSLLIIAFVAAKRK